MAKPKITRRQIIAGSLFAAASAPAASVWWWVDQVKENDLSRSRAREFPVMKIDPTIADALSWVPQSLPRMECC